MTDLLLVRPDADMEAQAEAFKNEFWEHGEKTIYGSNRLDMGKYSCAEWIALVSGLNDSPASPAAEFSHTFFAVRSDGAVVGIVNFRHPLEGFFADTGHIGYSIRPSERRKGYGAEILRKTLTYAKKNRMTEVFLVCEQANEASRRTILKNNGVLRRTFVKKETVCEEYQVAL